MAAPDPRAPRFPDVPVVAEAAPPPISGGTLIVLADQSMAVAADPDRDRIFFVDLLTRQVVSTVVVPAGSEPGRLAEGGGGRVHVALRRSGKLLTIDSSTGTLLATRDVCAAPRGVAWDAKRSVVWVACVDGTLVSLPDVGYGIPLNFHLDDDLRDVVVDGDTLYVSRFRSAQVIAVNAISGAVTQRFTVADLGSSRAAVAWRMRANPAGGVLLLHQVDFDAAVPNQQGAYGTAGGGAGDCSGSIVETGITALHVGLAWEGKPTLVRDLAVAVDFAVAPSGTYLTVASPANYKSAAGTMGVTVQKQDMAGGACVRAADLPGRVGQATAVAMTARDVLVQSREPAALYLSGAGVTIPLSSDSREDTGHAIFHNRSGMSIACASCHPEGGEDGRVWQFKGAGPRRTQSLRGGILATAPFHWDGALPALADVAHEVFVKRMGGPSLSAAQIDALGRFVDGIPFIPRPAPADPAAVARGKLLFESDATQCAICHSGPKLTSNQNASVGGNPGSFQVPSLLGLAARAPYLHDGCASTNAERFTMCVQLKDKHGVTSNLSAAQTADLVAYLASL